MYSKYLLQIIITISVVISLNGCGGGGSDSGATTSNSTGSNPETTTISHNSIGYNTITSSTTGRVWLDRNLGSSKSCSSSDDRACYGDYYQWGRETDGHEKASSSTTTTLATGISSAGDKFIISLASDKDWTQVDVNGSQREEKWSAIDGSSVCPIGYRVPTSTELDAEMITSISDAYSKLKLPAAGFRSITGGYEGQVLALDTAAYIYTTSLDGNRTYRLMYGTGTSTIAYQHTTGYSVRCIKDESSTTQPPSTGTTITYADIAGTWGSLPDTSTTAHVYLTFNANNSGFYTFGTTDSPMTYTLNNNVIQVTISGNTTYSLDGKVSAISNGVMSFDINYNGSIGTTDNWYKSTKVVPSNTTATGFLTSYEISSNVSTSVREILVDNNGDMQIDGFYSGSSLMLKLNAAMTTVTTLNSTSTSNSEYIKDIVFDKTSGNSLSLNTISGTRETYLDFYNGTKSTVAQTNLSDPQNTEIITNSSAIKSKSGLKLYLPNAQLYSGLIQYKTKSSVSGHDKLHLYDTQIGSEILSQDVEGLANVRLYADGVMYEKDNSVKGYDLMLYNKNTQVTKTLSSQSHMQSLCYTYASDANYKDGYGEKSSTLNNGLYDNTVIPGIMYKNPASSSESIVYYIDCEYPTDVQYEKTTNRLLVFSTPSYSTVLAVVGGGSSENVWMKERLDGSVIYAYNDDNNANGIDRFEIKYFKLGSLTKTIATSSYPMRSNMLVTSKYVIYETIDTNYKTSQYIYDGVNTMPLELNIPNRINNPIALNYADNSENYMVTTDGYRNIYKIDIENYVQSYKTAN